MTKDEFASYLAEKGYPAENVNGIVMINKGMALTKEDLESIHAMMREKNYNASYGYTLRNTYMKT